MNEYQAKDRKATRILPDEVAPRVGLAPDTPRYHLAVDYLLDRGALKPAEWPIHAGEVCNPIEPKPPTPPAAALYARPRVVRGGWGLSVPVVVSGTYQLSPGCRRVFRRVFMSSSTISRT
jgi:hypothetical protein